MINETVKALAKGANFGALTTLFKNGQPQTNVMWIDADDDHVLINTEVHRQKYKNASNDPRVAIAIIDVTNPYHYAEVRGRVVAEVRGAEARSHIDELSMKYTGDLYKNPIQSERVILKIHPESERIQ